MAQCRHRAISEHPFLYMTHPFDQSLSIESPGPHLWRSPSSPLYWNAIGPYGGWIAAMLLHAVQSEPSARGDPIALQAQFAGPIRQAPFTLATSCLRQSRSTAFWRSELRQPDETGAESVCAHASITLSSWRETATISDAVMPMAAPAQGLASAPPRPLTRTTAILALCFFITSIGLTLIARHGGGAGGSLFNDTTAPAGQAPETGGSVLPQLPAAPATPQVPVSQ